MENNKKGENMKISKIFLILIIGIISLSFITAGEITSKNYLIKGELTITDDLHDACADGGTWSFSSNILNQLFFASINSCTLEIYSPNSLDPIRTYTGLTAEAIKQGLNSGIVIGPILIGSTDILTFTIRIKNYSGTLLLETPIRSISPSSGIKIGSDYLKNTTLSNTPCNSGNLGDVAVIDNKLTSCVYYSEGGYLWQEFAGTTTPYISNFLQLFQKFDHSRFTVKANPTIAITLLPITNDIISNHAVSINKLDQDVINRLGTQQNDDDVQIEGEFDDYLRIQTDTGEWYYVKLYPAKSFISFQGGGEFCFYQQVGLNPMFPTLHIQRNRIPLNTITVTKPNLEPNTTFAVTYYENDGDPYFRASATQMGTYEVKVSGTDDSGVLRTYTGTITFGDYNWCPNSPPNDDELVVN